MPQPITLLDDQFLQRLEYFRLLSRKPARGHWKGIHRARKTGAGMEFADYRPYSEGDDLKSVDWRTYLRLNRLILRLYEEEADLPIYIFLDSSASMNFGAPTKFDYGRKVAAALAYLGFINMDRVSLIAFSDGVLKDISGQRGKSQAWPAFRFLEETAPAGGTSLETAIKRYFAAPRTRGLVIVLSDFLDNAGFEPGFRALRQFRHEVFAVQILSAQELEPALPEEVVLIDAEDGASCVQRVTPALIAAYRDAMTTYCEQVESACSRNGWGYLRAQTSTPFEALVLRVLRKEGLLK